MHPTFRIRWLLTDRADCRIVEHPQRDVRHDWTGRVLAIPRQSVHSAREACYSTKGRRTGEAAFFGQRRFCACCGVLSFPSQNQPCGCCEQGEENDFLRAKVTLCLPRCFVFLVRGTRFSCCSQKDCPWTLSILCLLCCVLPSCVATFLCAVADTMVKGTPF